MVRAISLAALLLFPLGLSAADDVIRSVRDGAWSAGGTWEGGKVPTEGSKVLIRPGHRIIYDANSDETIRAIYVGGTLSFDPTKDTKLTVGLIKIQPGEVISEDGFDCDAHAPEIDPTKP